MKQRIKKVLIITGGRHGQAPYPLVRPDFDMVHIPVLWKRGREYRIFPAKLLDKIYQLRKKTKSVSVLWEQGIPVDAEVGKILMGA
jgi:hypothetical protein